VVRGEREGRPFHFVIRSFLRLVCPGAQAEVTRRLDDRWARWDVAEGAIAGERRVFQSLSEGLRPSSHQSPKHPPKRADRRLGIGMGGWSPSIGLWDTTMGEVRGKIDPVQLVHDPFSRVSRTLSDRRWRHRDNEMKGPGPTIGAMERMDRLVNVKELASYLDVPVKTLYAWRYRREGPPAFRVGRHLRYRWSDVERWVEGRVDTGPTGPVS
jgi:excisionase family DNA binding protein